MPKQLRKTYSSWFLVPVGIVFFMLFLLPTIMSFFFSLTTWTLTSWTFTGFDNLRMFFREMALRVAFRNTLVHAVLSSGSKVVLGLVFGAILSSNYLRTRNFLRSVLYFPNLISTLAVGITFKSLMHPTRGLISAGLAAIGIAGPDWLGNPNLALYSVILVNLWKGVGVATVIYIAGIVSIPSSIMKRCPLTAATPGTGFLYPRCRCADRP